MLNVESPRSVASDVVRRLPTAEWSYPELIRREWLVTNGLGGYASGTLAGPPTRRYHSLLVAALPAPLGRLALLARLDERIRLPSRRVAWLSRAEPSPVATITRVPVGWRPAGVALLARLGRAREAALHAATSTTRSLSPTGCFKGPDGIRLGLRPMLGVRMHEAPVNRTVPEEPVVSAHDRWLDVTVGESVPHDPACRPRSRCRVHR